MGLESSIIIRIRSRRSVMNKVIPAQGRRNCLKNSGSLGEIEE